MSSTPEQTLELVQYYKSHPDQWQKVRENAVLSVQNHSYINEQNLSLKSIRNLVCDCAVPKAELKRNPAR